jgi:hypothetical protein
MAELRRMIYQTTPSAILCVLSNARAWLTNALTVDGNVVGAEELFQFFVFAIACADMRYLPSLISFVRTFMDDGLRDTRFGYLFTQLSCSLDFIHQALLPVKPFLIFPFRNVPPALKDNLTFVSSVVMRGFATYAFPSFTPNLQSLFPALLQYTGVEGDVSICNQFQLRSTVGLLPQDFPPLNTVPTLQGSFLQLQNHVIARYQMILIDNGNFDDRIEDVQMMSAMLKMAPVVKRPKLADLETLYAEIAGTWKMRGSFHALNLKAVLTEIQRALVIINPALRLAVDGIMTAETVEAIAGFCGLPEDATFSPEDFDLILNALCGP